MVKSRPIVRYHGGKWMIAPWIIENLPSHRVYVEPFGGGGSVLLRKPRSYAEVYNDLDGEMVNLFRVARDHGEALKEKLCLTPFSRDEFEISYIGSECAIEQARRTVVRCFMGFGSAAASGRATGFRNNSNRSGTTPAHDWANYPKALEQTIQRLQGVVIENKDALALIQQTDSEDTLFYCDPPYPKGTRSDGGDDYKFEMTDSDHIEFLDLVKSLRGMVVISGYACSLYDDALAGWETVDKDTLSDGAGKRVERLWISPKSSKGRLF
jgi:DNA adenine methylase